MKGRFLICAAAVVCMLASCSKEGGIRPTATPKAAEIYSLNPSDVLTADNLSMLVTYPLICNVISDTPESKTLLCQSDPAGNDPIRIDVEQYSEKTAKSDIAAKYNSDKAKRSSAEDIELESGFEGYIAYPYVKIYHDGYYITVTAGSGNDDEQKQLLTEIAAVAVKNIKGALGEVSASNTPASPESTAGGKG